MIRWRRFARLGPWAEGDDLSWTSSYTNIIIMASIIIMTIMTIIIVIINIIIIMTVFDDDDDVDSVV